jgi:glutamate transport system permease protein
MNSIIENVPIFWGGFVTTLGLVALAGVMSLSAGVILASFSIAPIPLLRRFSAVYVAIMRNIPAAAHLFFTVFILPLLGFQFDFFVLALIGITVYFAAYYSDAIRSGINAIGAGQFEAARAMGLKKIQTLRLLVLPQGLRNSVPPLINTTIALIKVTAIAGIFGVTELFGTMLQLINTNDSAVIALMLFTAVLYSAITIPAALASAALERRVVFSS